jgi:hypothetical protein
LSGQARDLRFDVARAGREDHEARAQARRTGLRLEHVARLAQPLDAPDLQARAELRRVRAHSLEQLLARDAVGKAEHVARLRDQREAALAFVDDDDAALEAAEIHGRHQPRRAAADHEAIEHHHCMDIIEGRMRDLRPPRRGVRPRGARAAAPARRPSRAS